MGYPSLTMYDVRCPSELLYGLEDSAGEEDGSFPVVFEIVALIVAVYALAVEIVLVVNEVHLHPGCRNGSHLDDKRSVDIVDDDVHSGQTDDLMELVLSFVDATISRHECSYLLFPFLNTLRKVSSYVGNLRFRKVREYFRIDEQDSFNRIIHTLYF